jgi:hypothetical protein
LVEEPEGRDYKKYLDVEDNIKIDFSGLGYGRFAGFCEHGNELFSFSRVTTS